MKNLNVNALLEERIKQMESKRDAAFVLLKEQTKLTVESWHPIQMLKEVFHSSETKINVVDSAIGMATGYIAKKAVTRSSKNSLLKLFGSAIGFGVANFVRKHPDGIKFIAGKIFNKFFNTKPESAQ